MSVAMRGNSRVTPEVTVVITTRNRVHTVEHAIRSALLQSVAPAVLVVDDASTDNTATLVTSTFPNICVLTMPQNIGIVAARNLAIRHVTTDFVAVLDDDAVYSDTACLERAIGSFEIPRIAVVDFRVIDHIKDDVRPDMVTGIAKPASHKDAYLRSTYHGGACIMRRDVFLNIGGYIEFYNRQFEETDYALRLLDRGFFVAAELSCSIDHFPSPRRGASPVGYFDARNTIVFNWQYVPSTRLISRMAIATAGQIRVGFKQRNLRKRVLGIKAAFAEIIRGSRHRIPVSLAIYRVHRLLIKKRFVSPVEIEYLLQQI